jgi:hypothetical protein
LPSKALKVPELKAVLTKAGVKPAPKATKADLIKTILENPAACDAFSGSNGDAAVTEEVCCCVTVRTRVANVVKPSIAAEPAVPEPEAPAPVTAAPAATTSEEVSLLLACLSSHSLW